MANTRNVKISKVVKKGENIVENGTQKENEEDSGADEAGLCRPCKGVQILFSMIRIIVAILLFLLLLDGICFTGGFHHRCLQNSFVVFKEL